MTKAVTIAARTITLVTVLFVANPRAGFTQDGGMYVATCTGQSVVALGLAGPRAHTFIDNPFGALAMQAFGCW